MGTLFDQPGRDSMSLEYGDVNEVFNLADKLSANENISIQEAIQIVQISEYSRRTTIMVQNGDVHDEQMAGIGELIKSFVDKVDFIANQIEEIKQRI